MNIEKIFEKYNNMKILVTGGAGFVGSNLVKSLYNYNAKITVLDDLFTGREINLKDCPKIDFIEGSVTDEKLIEKLIKDVDMIFHLAARNIIISTKDPKEDYFTNIGGTLELLLAIKNNPSIKRLIYTSSASIYGNPKYLPINEEDSFNLLSPYAVSKLGGENYCTVFYENFQLPISIVRYSNIFGPFQTPDNPYAGVIGKFIGLMLNDSKPEIHGDGEQTRDFTYVDDAVEATLLTALSPRAEGEVFNVGTGVETSINKLCEVINKLLDKNIVPEYIDKRDIDNIRRRVINIEKIRKKIRWVPRYTLEKGIFKTIEWFKNKSDE